MGGVIGSLLHTRDINVVDLITIGSPLKGASILTREKDIKFNVFGHELTFHKAWVSKILSVFIKDYTPNHNKLVEMSIQDDVKPPKHPYHCVTMSWPFTDCDGCVFVDEGYFSEEHHTHLRLADHRTVFANVRLWHTVKNLIMR